MDKIKKFMLPDITDKMYKNEAISSISLAKLVGEKINEIICYLNEFESIRDAKYLEQDGKIQKAIIFIKDNLENTCRDLLEIMKNNGELGTLIEDSITKLNKEISRIYENRIIHIDEFTPDVFFALDNTSVISQALALKKDEPSKIMFAQKTYTAKGTIDLYSNTEIDLNGATIESAETEYNETSRDSGGLRFINSDDNMKTGLENITIKNGTFKGGATGILFAFLKGKNILIENVKFENCCLGTHIFDLAGCENVKFINCDFIGCSLESATNYREMIQLDYANYNAFPYKGDNIAFAFDDSSCSNIHIEGCTFEKGDGTTYPNAIGTHSTREAYHHHITIKNNKFYDCTKACIRFLRVHNLKIEKNEFINSNYVERADTSFILLDNGRFEEICKPDFEIIIKENIVRTEIQKSNIMLLNMYSDVTTGVFHRDIEILNNIINGSYDAIENGADCFRFGNVENVNISGNLIQKYKNVVFFRNNYNAKNISVVNNKIVECRTLEQKFDTSTIENVYYKGNTWIKDGKMSLKQNKIFEEIFTSTGAESGDIALSKSANDFDYLLVSTGGIDNNTYMTSIFYPFNFELGFRPGEDIMAIPTASGKCVLKVKDENTLTIVSASDKLRRIYGVTII